MESQSEVEKNNVGTGITHYFRKGRSWRTTTTANLDIAFVQPGQKYYGLMGKLALEI